MLINIPGIGPHKLPINQELKLIDSKEIFQTGKVLKGTVISAIGENKLALNINGQTLTAKTSHHFLPGEELTLTVEKKANEIVLKIQDHQLSQKILTQALRQVLPKQAPLSQIINIANSLKDISSGSDLPKTPQENALPIQVIDKLKQLSNQLPTLKNISNSIGLKNSIENSGVFLENKILNANNTKEGRSTNLASDFKNQLLKLLQSIDKHLHTSIDKKPEASTIAIDKNLLIYSSIAPKNLPTLDQGVRLLRAANLLRSINYPSPNNEQLTEKMPQVKKEGYQYSTNTHRPPSFIKHASLPIKGAIPQPVSNAHPDNPPKIHTLETIKAEITSALARIQANQLSFLGKDANIQPAFLLDLPIQIDDSTSEVIPFLIQEEDNSKSNSEQEKNWSITIALDMDNLGPLQIKASMKNDKINVNIGAELSQTKRLFEENNHRLKEALKEEQINTGLFSYSLGLKENEINPKTLNLLDLKI